MQIDLNEALTKIIQKGQQMSRFEKNLLAVSEYSSSLARKLLEINTNEKFQIYVGKDPIDINIIDPQTYEYMFENPAKEVEEKIVEFEREYSRYPALFFYGLGNGVFIKTILENRSHRRVVIFEPEVEIIYAVLNLFDFWVDLHETRLIILQSQVATPSHYYAIVKYDEILRSARIYDLHVYNKFYEKYSDDIVQINKMITTAFKQAIYETGNDADDTLIGIEHHTKNIPNMIANLPIRNIIKARAKSVRTAIIVSTGPSLYKQLETLKKIAPYATIISIDASYPILKKHDIKPDYVTSVERVELTSKFFQDKPSEFDKNIIFIASSLTHPATIANLDGRNVCYAMRPLYYERGFKDTDYGYLGQGPSAAHLAYDLANALGHEKIVFIGQDLAFGKDGHSHSEGHIFSSTEIDPNGDETAPAYGGKGVVKTTLVWNLFRRYFENIIIFALNKGIQIYNCTEGGARIEGMKEAKFSQIADETMKQKRKKLRAVAKFSQFKQKTHLNRARKHVKSTIAYGERIEKRASKLFLKLAAAVKKAKKLKENGKESQIDYAKLQQIASEVDKIKDMISEVKFVTSFWGVCGLSLLHQDLDLSVIMVRNTHSEQDKKDKLFEWVSLQGYWLFSLAGYIHIELEKIKSSAQEWLE